MLVISSEHRFRSASRLPFAICTHLHSGNAIIGNSDCLWLLPWVSKSAHISQRARPDPYLVYRVGALFVRSIGATIGNCTSISMERDSD